MSILTTDRTRKSVKLTKEEYAAFSKWVKEQPTKLDAVAALGIARFTLDRILQVKSVSPDTHCKIKKVLGTASDRREEEKATA